MNRLAGIIVAAAGLIIAVLSVAKIVPGLTPTGVILILFGGLIIGLSFVDKPAEDGAERMSTLASLVNIFVSPGEVFKNLRRHPRWLVALLLMSLMSAAYSGLFASRIGTDRITNFQIDKTLQMPMIANNDDAKKGVESGRAQALADAKNPVVRAGQALSGVAGSAFGFAFLALIFFLFALAMGGKLNFWQAFSAAVYASFPVAVIRFILNTTILFIKDPNDIHPILGQQTLIQDNLNFLVLSSEHPVIFTILGAFSLLTFYWMWMTATGLKNAGERVTSTIAWSSVISIFVLMLLLGVVMATLFPSFIS